MSRVINKAVITAAGLGTRLLPATKNVPKEMLPILNKPMIHYVVKQCLDAGIKQIIIVIDKDNTAVKDYFEIDPKLVSYLQQKNKLRLIEEIQEICNKVEFKFVFQDTSLPYGNARPLYSAKGLIDQEPFVYMYGDGIMFGEGAGVCELINHYQKYPSKVVLTGTVVPPKQMLTLGMVRLAENSDFVVKEVIEKPKPDQIDSNIASVCSYIFDESIFEFMDPSNVQPSEEFQIQDAINKLIQNENVTVCISKGKFLTNGDIFSYLEMIIEEALSRPDTREEFFKILNRIVDSL